MQRVAVLVPPHRVDELKRLVEQWREEYRKQDDPAAVPGRFAQGGDAKAISRVANQYFGGYREMFVAHDWPERGSEMMRKVQSRVKETYGSIAAFEEHFPPTD